MSQRLSLSLGLRWDVNPAPGVTQGLKPYTVQGSGPDTWALAPQGTPLWQTTYGNFAPRLGVAYVLNNTPGRETVVRGGGGVFFDTGQQLGSLGFLGPGFIAVGGYLPGSFPVLPSGGFPVIQNPPVAPYNTGSGCFSPLICNCRIRSSGTPASSRRWESHRLSRFPMSASHASRLLANNFILCAQQSEHELLFDIVENGLTSDYDSLQVQFRRRLSHGLTTLASYTWSHCIDYGSQNYTRISAWELRL